MTHKFNPAPGPAGLPGRLVLLGMPEVSLLRATAAAILAVAAPNRLTLSQHPDFGAGWESGGYLGHVELVGADGQQGDHLAS